MKKYKIYENNDIVIYYKKGEMEVGQEADLSDQVLVAAMMGYLEFAKHLKDPLSFWRKCKKEIRKTIRMQDQAIIDL